MTDGAARRAVVGVLGSGTVPHADLAGPLGAALARAGVHLLTGGGAGVMESTSAAFASVSPRSGLVLGVLPGAEDSGRPPLGYPNPYVEIVIRTHLPHSGSRGTDPQSRNHINVLSSDVLVALPGGAGTSSEVRLARRYGVPVIVYAPDERGIPSLDQDVPRAVHLDDVMAFVKLHVERTEVLR